MTLKGNHGYGFQGLRSIYPGVAQLAERLIWDQEAASSSLATWTNYIYRKTNIFINRRWLEVTKTEKQKLYMKRALEFIKKHPNILELGNTIAINQIKMLEESRLNTEIAWRNYKKKVEEFERKERKRKHNKKKSDRMKRLRVKKEKKRA